MQAQQNQNTKGFSLLELLVLLAIVSVISGIGFPKFSTWSKDRTLRTDAEKIASLFTYATTQVERGSYPYVRVEFESGSSPGKITAKGISQQELSKKINGPKDPTCLESDFTTWTTIDSHTLDKEIYLPILAPKAGTTSSGSGAAICFSKGGKYFKQHGSAKTQQNINFDNNTSATNNYVAVCHLKSSNCDVVGKVFDDDYSTYLVRYSRFGLITKYKFNKKAKDWSGR